MSNEISWSDFQKIDIRVGTIIRAEEFPEARNPAYKVWVDFGEEIGVLKSSAQITDRYDLTQLKGKQILGVVNFPPKQIGPFMSECLITGVYDTDETVILAVPDEPLPNGTRLG
ncbi:MAG: tRNA-binding protein [Bacteroidota bacterium]